MTRNILWRGHGFGDLELPRGAVVTSDLSVTEYHVVTGGIPDEIRSAQLLVVHLGRLKTSNRSAPRLLEQIVVSRNLGEGSPDRQTWFLETVGDPQCEWFFSRDKLLKPVVDRFFEVKTIPAGPSGPQETIEVPEAVERELEADEGFSMLLEVYEPVGYDYVDPYEEDDDEPQTLEEHLMRVQELEYLEAC